MKTYLFFLSLGTSFIDSMKLKLIKIGNQFLLKIFISKCKRQWQCWSTTPWDHSDASVVACSRASHCRVKFSLRHQQLIRREAVSSPPAHSRATCVGHCHQPPERLIMTIKTISVKLTASKVAVAIKLDVTHFSLKVIRKVQPVRQLLFHWK